MKNNRNTNSVNRNFPYNNGDSGFKMPVDYGDANGDDDINVIESTGLIANLYQGGAMPFCG